MRGLTGGVSVITLLAVLLVPFSVFVQWRASCGPELLVDSPRGPVPMTEVLPDAFGARDLR